MSPELRLDRGERLPALRTVAVWLAVLVALLVWYAVVTLGQLGGAGLEDASGRWVYDAVLLGAAALVLVRAAQVPAERRAWLWLGLGLLLWALGQTYYSIALYYVYPAPFPSPADALFLGFYPATYIGLVALLRSRIERVDAFAWVDGLIGALAVAALTAALVFPPVLEALGGDPLGVAVSLAYPCADLVLLGLVAGALTSSGWRTRGAWLLIATALILFGISDVVYLSVSGQATGALDLASIGWPLAFLVIATAAWLPRGHVEPVPPRSERSMVLPGMLATAVIALLAAGSFMPIGVVAVGLGVASLLAVLARLATTFDLNRRVLALTVRDATTDALTGLKNRRRLIADLERALSSPRAEPMVLALLDLDGFKAYNDGFGHTAGDELLRRFGANLVAAVRPWGKAYRLGGDEFCVLVSTRELKAEVIISAAEAALTEHGPGFSIRASWGMVRLPAETRSVPEALRIADRRMYTHKGQRSDSVLSQTRGVLLSVLREREPMLNARLGGVAHLAATMGRTLGMDAEDLDVLVRAAEMHDIGKVAIPDEVLYKAGELSDDEWALMRTHPLIGERVLAAAPSLREVAKAVRSTHEHWDGSGYPDGLAGAAIPRDARMILICDAYHAMTGGRSYVEALSEEAAIAELRGGERTQFDPELVEVFVTRVLPELANQTPSRGRVSDQL